MGIAGAHGSEVLLGAGQRGPAVRQGLGCPVGVAWAKPGPGVAAIGPRLLARLFLTKALGLHDTSIPLCTILALNKPAERLSVAHKICRTVSLVETLTNALFSALVVAYNNTLATEGTGGIQMVSTQC